MKLEILTFKSTTFMDSFYKNSKKMFGDFNKSVQEIFELWFKKFLFHKKTIYFATKCGLKQT